MWFWCGDVINIEDEKNDIEGGVAEADIAKVFRQRGGKVSEGDRYPIRWGS